MTIELSNSKKTYLGITPDRRKRWALDCSIGAIRFRENGGERQDIDPSIEAVDSDGFSIKFTQVPYLGRIADDSRRRIYPDRTNLDCWIQFDKPFPDMPAPTRSDRWFYWDFPNALMGVRFDNASIKFGFQLKNSNAPTSITIPFTTQGITREGRLLYCDGKVIAELRKPVATDANEEERECGISFEAGEVTISLDTAELAFPIDIDPTLDLQVGANADDAHEDGDGDVYDTGEYIYHLANTTSNLYWGGHRWTSGSLPNQGDTIDVAYIQLYIYDASYDDIKSHVHFEKAASPTQINSGEDTYDITGRTRTTASVGWIKHGCGVGWEQSPSLVAPLQEVIDNYSPTAIFAVFRPYTDEYEALRSRAYNSYPTLAAKLHIEWTEPAEDHRRGSFLKMF